VNRDVGIINRLPRFGTSSTFMTHAIGRPTEFLVVPDSINQSVMFRPVSVDSPHALLKSHQFAVAVVALLLTPNPRRQALGVVGGSRNW